MAEIKDPRKMTYSELRTLSPEQIGEMTPQQLEHATSRMAFLKQQLELESLTMTVENERARRDAIKRAHEAQQKALDEATANIKASQKVCRHKKGGKNLEGILKGNDPNYSVMHITHAWGEKQVICTRCGKEWNDPDSFLAPIDRKSKGYEKAKAEFEAALQFETDNEPMGSQLFTITRTAPESGARA